MNQKRRLLIVDDDEIYAEELRELLDCYDITAVIARNLGKAIEQLEAEAWAAVLLDRRLGTEDGLDLIPISQANGHDPLFIVVTGDASKLQTKHTSATRVEVLLKPLAIDKLLQLLDRE